MRRDKYNVIFMKDLASARSFRLSPFWIKFFILFFILLLLISLAGSYYSLVFFQEKKEITRLYEHKAEALNEAKRELNRMQNVEKMLEKSREDELRSFLTVRKEQLPEQGPKENINVSAIDLRDIFEPVDLDIVGISNVQARFTQKGMWISLEVNNMGTKGRVSGRVFLALITNDGSMEDLLLDDTELNYVIARFRTMETTFDLPEGMNQDSLFALRIEARDDEDNLLYSEAFPLASILI
jgi:hypothetical protein